MKSYCFVYTTAIVLIAHIISWIVLIPTNFLHWWSKRFISWHCIQQRKRHNKGNMSSKTIYEFRPFELHKCDYKSYSRATSQRRGINFIPKPRSGHRIVANETDLFSFGGYNPDTGANLFQELLKFNFLTQKWSRVFSAKTNEVPKESVSNALTLKENCLFLFGGTGYPFGNKRSNETYLMWPYGSRAIEKLSANGNKPEQLYGQAILLQEHYLYVLGGTSGHEFTCDIHRLNLYTRTWEHTHKCDANIREEPPGRYRHEIACDDDYIYVFGGGTQEESFDMDIIPAFSLNENKYIFIQTKPDPQVTTNGGYPEGRKFHSCIQQMTDHGIEIIIAGGFQSPQKFFDDIWKFNLKTHQWQLFAQTKLPYTLYFHDAAATGNGLMYIFGGVTGNQGLRTNELHRMWVHIPTLSEMCWDALTFYHPTIVDRSKQELLSDGVPLKFADRVAKGRNIGDVV